MVLPHSERPESFMPSALLTYILQVKDALQQDSETYYRLWWVIAFLAPERHE